MDKFFDTLFADVPKGSRILIWKKTTTKKISKWLPDSKKAIEYVKKNMDSDIYVGCGIATDKFVESLGPSHPYKRCPADRIGGMPGLWLDLDLKDPLAHKKENLPETEEDIQKIIAKFPLKPSIVVHSGHGQQFWWKFKKFWAFTTDEERQRAADIAHRFTYTMREHARSFFYDVDMTFDLSRVFRIPGCFNYKSDPPIPTKLIHCNGKAYDPEEFVPYIVKALPNRPAVKPTESVNFKIDPAADVPAMKLEALCLAEPRFKRSWDHKRKDFKGNSPSEYDYSLANFALMAGWTHQEVVNLLIAFRRRHGLEPKLRADYFDRTIRNVLNTISVGSAQERIDDILLGIGETKDKTPEEKRRVALESVSEVFGLRIDRIIKYKADPPAYRMIVNGESIQLGPVENLINQIKLRNHIADATKHLIDVNKKVWPRIAQSMLLATEDESAGEDATEFGAISNFLQQYLVDKYPKITDDLIQAENTKSPFIKDGKVWIFGTDLRAWLDLYHKEKMTLRDMGVKLRAFGCSPLPMNMRISNEDNSLRATRNVWSLPSNHDLVVQIMKTFRPKND